ncbi:MAG: tetratricopeptide repeat protein [Desulfobia sp.]
MENEIENQEENKSQAQLDYEQGLEHLKNNEIAEAANMFHNALIGFEQDNNEHGIANVMDKLGDICYDNKDFDKALEYYERAYTICQKETDRFSLFTLEQKKAKIYLDIGDYRKALRAYIGVLDEFEALKNPRSSVDTLEVIADIYLKLGEKENAAEAYKVAASIHKNFNHEKPARELLQKAEEVLER